MFRIVETDEGYKGCSIERVEATPNYTLLIPRLAELLVSGWGSNIIVIDSKPAEYRLAYPNRSVQTNELSSMVTMRRTPGLKLLLDALPGCRYISISTDLYSRDTTPVHYGFETYELMARMIAEAIRRPEGFDIRCQKMLADFQYGQSLILNGMREPLSYLLSDVDVALKKDSDEKLDQCAARCLESLDNSTVGLVEKRLMMINASERYSKGSIDEAIDWGRNAISKGCSCLSELLSLLWKRGRPVDLEELFSLSKERSVLEDRSAYIWLARAYRDGKGTDKNPEEAVRWMRKAAGKNISGSRKELLDMIWSKGFPCPDRESLTVSLAEEGDPDSVVLLAKGYLKGDVLEQDSDKAILWARKAYAFNSVHCNLLFDAIWKKGD